MLKMCTVLDAFYHIVQRAKFDANFKRSLKEELSV